MNESDQIQDLIEYRLNQARESLAEAQLLAEGDGTTRGIINRAYYAMFYAVLALLIQPGKSVSKHGGVISAFDEDFVKPGLFDKNMSKAIHKAFELRQVADYREFAPIDSEDALEILKKAEEFVSAVEKYLSV